MRHLKRGWGIVSYGKRERCFVFYYITQLAGALNEHEVHYLFWDESINIKYVLLTIRKLIPFMELVGKALTLERLGGGGCINPPWGFFRSAR